MKLIIDTDPGIDDAMAILFAATCSRIELVGLTSVFGNVPVATATRNALWLAEEAGLSIPVAAGAARPLVQDPPPHPAHVHGADGFGALPPTAPSTDPDPRDAAGLMIDLCRGDPGRITICAVGPLTNLALALDRDPGFAASVARVIVMGGAVHRGGNVTPHAEANIWQDPHAAAAVLAAPWPVTLIGLDVTEQVRCSPGDFAAIAAAAPRLGGFLAAAAEHYAAFHRDRAGFLGCFLHDPTAVIAATDPELFLYEDTPLGVTLAGAEAGRTRAEPGAASTPVRVAVKVRAGAVTTRFLGVLRDADACRAARLG